MRESQRGKEKEKSENVKRREGRKKGKNAKKREKKVE